MKLFKSPLLVPTVFFLAFIAEGIYHIFGALGKHNTLKIVTNSIGIAISLAGIILMLYYIKKSGAKSVI